MAKYYSWETIGNKIAIKTCDKSSIIHHGSGLPKEMRWFFDADDLKYGENLYFKILYKGKKYDGHVNRETHTDRGRTRIFWDTELKNELIIYKDIFDRGIEIEYRFEKINSKLYKLDVISDEYIKSDVENEDFDYSLPGLVDAGIEGKKIGFYSTRYERNSKNRKAAIRIHGLKCQACGFDFEESYGERGKDFIEVHHIKPLYENEMEVEVNPETDLVCLCSNCHRMIHRNRNDVLSIEGLKQLLRKN